nr:hypothetical protein [Tanacetum cinerariifolium]
RRTADDDSGLDRSNEMIAKHLHEYEQAAVDLTIGEKIELNNKLVKYQDHHSKIIKVNSPSFLGRTVLLFDSMLVHEDEGSGTPTEPHHTPSPEAQQSLHTAPSSPSLLPAITEIIPTSTPTEIPTLRQYSRRARIAQSLAFPTAANEPASHLKDDSQGEACPTVSGLEAG